MSIKELLIARKNSYDKNYEIARERTSKVEELYKLTKLWLKELGVLELLKIEDHDWTNEYKMPESSYLIRGYGIDIWIRHIKDPRIMQVMIGNSEINFKTDKWYYNNGESEKEFCKEIFEEILIKEISFYRGHY